MQDKVNVTTGGPAGVGRTVAPRAEEPLGPIDLQGDDRVQDQSAQVWATERIGWHRRVAAVVVITLAAAVGGALATLCQGRRRGEWGELGKAGGGWRRR